MFVIISYFPILGMLMLSQILPVIFLYFLQNKWIVLLNVKCPGKCCSPPPPVCAELCRTLSSPGEYCRSLTEIQLSRSRRRVRPVDGQVLIDAVRRNEKCKFRAAINTHTDIVPPRFIASQISSCNYLFIGVVSISTRSYLCCPRPRTTSGRTTVPHTFLSR